MTLYIMLIFLLIILISIIIIDIAIKQRRYNTIRKIMMTKSDSAYYKSLYRDYLNLIHKMRSNLPHTSSYKNTIPLPDKTVISLYEDAFKGK